jgi:hypothetical protein
VPELGPLGSVRGAFSNERPYREYICYLAAYINVGLSIPHLPFVVTGAGGKVCPLLSPSVLILIELCDEPLPRVRHAASCRKANWASSLGRELLCNLFLVISANFH